MFRLLLIFTTFCLSFSSTLSSKIIETYDLDSVQEYFQNLTSQSLLLWDVDSTLIYPTDQILRPINDDRLEDFIALYFNGKTREERHWLFSLVHHRCSFSLVDTRSVELIASLHSRSIPMIAFTAMRTGPYGKIPSMEEWRVNQLRLLGIDFSTVFPQHSELEWEEYSPFLGYPAFKEGVLCSDSLPKGGVLTSFLQKIDWKPDQVLFIDDQPDFLASVEKAMEAMKIPFIGIHYRAVEKLEPLNDEEMAHHQFRVLINEGIWLSDEEAKSSLVENQEKS